MIYRLQHLSFICGIILLCQLPSNFCTNSQKSRNKLNLAPTRRIVPLSSEDLLAAQVLKQKDSLFDNSPLKRAVRKLENTKDVEDLSVLDNGDFQEYQGVVGKPGVDFPVLSSIPVTNFSCRKYKSPGYYADLDTNCQVFHVCDGGRKISFLCPNGTIFRQSHLICDWWFRVDCGKSIELYEESAEQLAYDQRSYKSKSKVSEKVNSPENTQSTGSNFQNNYNDKTQNVNNNNNNFQNGYSTTQRIPQNENIPPQNKNVPSQNTYVYTQNTYQQIPFNSKPNVPLNQPIQQNSQNEFQNLYTPQQKNTNLEKNNQPLNVFSNPQNRFRNNLPTSTTTSQPTFAGDNRLYDGESQVLAESVNYGSGKQKQYQSQNNYNNDVSTKYHSRNNQGRNNHQVANANPNPTPRTNYQQSTTQQGVVNDQQNIAYQRGTTQGQKQYNQQTTISQQTTYQQGATRQATTYTTPSTVSYDAPYSQSTVTPYSQSTETPFSYSTVTPFSQTGGSTQFSTFTTPYITSYATEFTTPAYSTIQESYQTKQFSNPTAYTTQEDFSSTASPSEFLSTSNFNPTSLDQSNFVPETINNAAEDVSNGNNVNSISIYYDQINNKESVQLPATSSDNKNKISVSEIILRDPLSRDTPNIAANPSQLLPSVLTDSTKEGYSFLFSNGSAPSHSENNVVNDENFIDGSIESTSEFPNSNDLDSRDLVTEQNQGLYQSFTSSTPYSTVPTTTAPTTTTESQKDLELRHSSDLRELAQVFSRALSAYLEDPENFRRILSEVRPTEPNVKTTTLSPHNNEVLEFSEDINSNSDFRRKNNPVTPTPYTTIKEDYTASSIASQVNDLAYNNSAESGNTYFSPPSNLYGGFQNNSSSYTLNDFTTSVFEGTTPTYYSVSPLIDLTYRTEAPQFSSVSTLAPTPSYDQSNSNTIGAREVNNLAPSRNLNDNHHESENVDDQKNNEYSGDKYYDYSFGANALKSNNNDDTDDKSDDEQLIPYDSQSIVSRDNLIRYQNAQRNYYSNLNLEQSENFSKSPQNYQSLTKAQNKVNHEKVKSHDITTTNPSTNYYSPSSFSTAGFISTETSTLPNLSTLQSYQTASQNTPQPLNQYTPQVNYDGSMYKEAKELFGNLNETSVNMLMNMMHEAESNTTLRRLVLLLVNDKSGKKTPEESRSKLLEALLQMPQRVPIYPPNSISRTYSPKIPRRVKVTKSRVLANNEKNLLKYQRDLSPVVTVKPTPQVEPLLQEKLSSESDSRAVELLKSLYVLAAKWG